MNPSDTFKQTIVENSQSACSFIVSVFIDILAKLILWAKENCLTDFAQQKHVQVYSFGFVPVLSENAEVDDLAGCPPLPSPHFTPPRERFAVWRRARLLIWGHFNSFLSPAYQWIFFLPWIQVVSDAKTRQRIRKRKWPKIERTTEKSGTKICTNECWQIRRALKKVTNTCVGIADMGALVQLVLTCK